MQNPQFRKSLARALLGRLLLTKLLLGGAVGLGEIGNAHLGDVEILDTRYIGHGGNQHGGNRDEEEAPPQTVEGDPPHLDSGQHALIHTLNQKGDDAGNGLQTAHAREVTYRDEDGQNQIDRVGNQGAEKARERAVGKLTVLHAETVARAGLPGGTIGQRQVEDDGGDAAPKKKGIALGLPCRHGQGEAKHGNGDLVEGQPHAFVGISFEECFHCVTLLFTLPPIIPKNCFLFAT